MIAYLVMQIIIIDSKRLIHYRDAVMPSSPGSAAGTPSKTEGVAILEGKRDEQHIAIFEFSSVDDIQAFWNSPDYVPVKALRQGAAVLEAWVVPESSAPQP